MVTIDESLQIHAPVERCFDLARCIEVHLRGTEKSKERAVGGVTTGLIGRGEFVRWEAKHLGVRQHLSSRITAFERPLYFQDTMIEGAFRFLQHDHRFVAITPNITEMSDHFVFAAPIPVFGIVAELLFLRTYMTKLLRERNRVLKNIAESDLWTKYLPNNG